MNATWLVDAIITLPRPREVHFLIKPEFCDVICATTGAKVECVGFSCQQPPSKLREMEVERFNSDCLGSPPFLARPANVLFCLGFCHSTPFEFPNV